MSGNGTEMCRCNVRVDTTPGTDGPIEWYCECSDPAPVRTGLCSQCASGHHVLNGRRT